MTGSDLEKKQPEVVSVSSLLLDKVKVAGKTINIDDGDQIMKMGLDDDEGVELTPERERRLVRKIDMFMLPLMCMVYCFQFMDKLSNSFASILGLREDLGMVGQEYAWTGSGFYLGYLVFELPASFILQKFPVAKAVGTFILLWGVILCLHSVPHNFVGFVTLRTLLGMLESSITPAFTFITSQWYTIDQTFLRISCWFAFNGLGSMLGSFIAYGLYTHSSSLSIVPWKLVFIITGVLTIFLGFLIILHLPDSPATAWFLTDEDKKLIVHRNRKNHQGFGNKHFKKEQAIEAIIDYKTWFLFAYVLIGNIPNGGITNFGSILLNEQLGFSTGKALLYQTIGGAVELVGCILLASGTMIYASRMFWASIGQALGTMGMLMLTLGKDPKLKFAGYSMFSLSPTAFICVLSCVASNVLGTTKKYVTNVIVLIGYCVGNLAGSTVFKANEAPAYGTAKRAITVCGITQFLLILAIWVMYFFENKRRDKKPEPEKIENIEFLDLTDLQNPFFRYSY